MNQELIYFGKQLKKLRKRHGYALEKLAEIIEISPNHISKLERAKTNPSFQVINKIAIALNIEMKDLFDFNEYKSDEQIREEFIRVAKISDSNYLQLLYKIYKDITNY